MAGLDEELDALFGLPLDEFTSARNDLAKRLRASDAEAAEAVRALPKPTISAWTINRLSREDRDGVTALLEAGAALREARRLLAGDDASERCATRRLGSEPWPAPQVKGETVLTEAKSRSDAGNADGSRRRPRRRCQRRGPQASRSGRLTTDLESSD